RARVRDAARRQRHERDGIRGGHESLPREGMPGGEVLVIFPRVRLGPVRRRGPVTYRNVALGTRAERKKEERGRSRQSKKTHRFFSFLRDRRKQEPRPERTSRQLIPGECLVETPRPG